jgi:hypothetical protein
MQPNHTAGNVSKAGYVHIRYHGGALVQPLLRWKNNKYYIFWVCVCSPSYAACNVRAPRCHLWPVRPYNIFPRLIHSKMFEKKSYWTWKVCFDFLCKFCLQHFAFLIELNEMWQKMYIGIHVKYPLFLSDCNETWIFSKYCRKNTQISNFMKIRSLGRELFCADRHEANRSFSKFWERAWRCHNAALSSANGVVRGEASGAVAPGGRIQQAAKWIF